MQPPTESAASPAKPARPPSFSVSQIKLYLRCPAAYMFRYVQGLVPPSTSAQMLGTAVHSGIELNYRKKIETRRDLPLEQVKEFYSASFDYLKGKVLWERGEVPGRFKDDGVRMLSLYQTEVAPRVQPKLVEELFVVPFQNTEYSFKGIIDLYDETGLVVDHKTTSRTPNPETVHKDLQLTAYAMGLRYKEKQVEIGMAFDYIVRAKTPKIIRIESSRSQEDIDRFLRLLGQVATAIKEGRFYPNPTSFYCSSRWCAYWSQCEGGRKL